MHNVVTLFFSRQSAREGAESFTTTLRGLPVEALVWPPLADAARRSIEVVEENLGSHGGGLVITRLRTTAQDSPLRAALEIRPTTGARFTPSSRLLRFDATGAARFQALRPGAVSVGWGEHLLIPVDAAAEKLLDQFVAGVQGLPSSCRGLARSTAAPAGFAAGSAP